MFMMPPQQLDRRHRSQDATPGRVTRLAAFGDFAPLAPSASLARASPVTSSRITIVAGDFVHVRRAADRVGSDRPVPVSTPIIVAPLNTSVMSMTVQQFHREADSLRTGRALARLVAPGDIAPLMPSDSLRSSPTSTRSRSHRPVRASPVTGFRITPSSGVLATADDADGLLRTSAVTAVNVLRRVLPATPITTAPLNISVISMAVQQFDHFADSLRTRQVQARLVAFGDIAPITAVGLAALVLVTGLRTTPCTCVSTTAGATAITSVNVLDTTAFTTSRTLRHSVAVAAPLRRVPRRPSPFACAPGFFVPDRLRGLWFSHPTHLRCSC